GRREEAIAKVPEEMVLQSNLVGDEKAIRERLVAYKRAGVSTLRVQPAGQNMDDQLKTLGATIDLIADLD
ncbi:MAG: F420-dependent methylene-tetrahydromethanopterin reductase, partial [Pseudomonadota bacterium]|nr:F420-dependent methylene-tetrahydromethanopterin reductase [Pseudomonadota bacterium]